MRTITDTNVVTDVWQGGEGYARFRERYAYATSQPSAFDAALSVLAVDGVLIGRWTTTPVSGTGYRPGEAHAAMLLTVSEGSLRYAVEGRVVDGGRGTTHLLSTLEGVRFTIREPSRFTIVMIPEALLRAAQRAVTARSVGPVEHVGAIADLAGLVAEALDPETGGADGPAARSARALALEVLEASVPDTPDLGLRDRILDHIERRLDDVHLGARSIADDFGVSVRWVRHAFDDDEGSIVRHIRARRLDTVAGILRSEGRIPRLGSLAERTGFPDRDLLARAFTDRYGTTVAQYAALAADGRAPGPVDAAEPHEASAG